MIKNVWFGLCVVLILAVSCNSGKMYKISGTVEDGDGMMVYLKKEIGDKKFLVEDSVEVKNGAFVLSGKIQQVDKRVLTLGKNEQALFLDEVPMQVTATRLVNKEGKKLDAYDLKLVGSVEQEILNRGKQLEMGKNLLSLGSMFAMMQVKDDSVKLDSTWRAMEMLKSEVNKSIKNFIDSNTNRMAITYMIGDFIAREYPFEDVERYYGQLTPEVKASYPGQLLKDKVEKLRFINVGGIAPDIDLTAPDGKQVKLSSLRGKFVLLDLWASWCGPCLAEVPNVKAIYEEYKDKGFEVYGVSLDDKKDAWVNAIEKHGLPWVHVSSLKGWECPVAKRYNVTGIPKMYLLDKEGRIVAMDLRGEALKEKVASFFN